MKLPKLIQALLLSLTVGLFCVSVAHADVTADVWVECSIDQVQTGMKNGNPDTRMMLTAIDGSFTETWLIVSTEAANMVAATALTAYTLEQNLRVHIIAQGTGFRIDAVRVLP